MYMVYVGVVKGSYRDILAVEDYDYCYYYYFFLLGLCIILDPEGSLSRGLRELHADIQGSGLERALGRFMV